MQVMDEMALLKEYAARSSESAFETLVSRRVNFVYSAALRQVRDPHLAEEITQAVFVILAQKAGRIPDKTILSGWLFKTTRFVAVAQTRAAIKRQQREQEAHMQSEIQQATPDRLWEQMSPLLDEALAQLGEKDRQAVLLRFFENKSMAEVGSRLGTGEDTARKRVSRALEKLRSYFSKRGVASTTTIIAGIISTNSVHAAPAGLTISAAAITQGAAASGSTLTLVEGTLKLMAWTKAKMVIAVGVSVLAVGTTTVVIEKGMRSDGVQEQRLNDGSLLVLNRVSVESTNEFLHGSSLATMLGKSIPSNGISLRSFKLNRPTAQTFSVPGIFPGNSQMVAEFKLLSTNPAIHPLVKPAFYRQFRCVVSGERGIEYVQEFWPSKFQQYQDGYFGYVIANSFPRDSRRLSIRIEKREDKDKGGPWKKLAEFQVENLVPSKNRAWTSDSIPAVKIVDEMEFELGQIMVETHPYLPRDIWNHVVTLPFQVRSNGVSLTNWTAPYVRVEDASGNWEFMGNGRRHRSLDPRYVWKLEMDFEPASDFSPENLATARVPVTLTAPMITDVAGVPVTFSWVNEDMLTAAIPTNRLDLALKLVTAQDERGKNIDAWTGSWNQHGFWKRVDLPPKGESVQATIAIVPNVHVTFYTQPRLLTPSVEKN